MKINQGITFAILIWNLLVFMIYGIDKSKAKEVLGEYLKNIYYHCILMWCFGAWLAGITFHHKTRKWYFKTVWFLGIVTTLVTLYFIWR